MQYGGWQKKRFWQEVSITPVGKAFEVMLDDRALKTPNKNALRLPTYALATLICEEWRAQERDIDPRLFVQTRRANSVIDGVGFAREATIAEVAAYGANDLLCYRERTDQALIARQETAWGPVLEWGEKELGLRLHIQRGIMPIAQSEGSHQKCNELVSKEGDFALVALSDVVSLTGSFLLGFAAVYRVWSLEEVWQKSRIDEEFQAEKWGRDEEATTASQQKYEAFCAAFAFYYAAQRGA